MRKLIPVGRDDTWMHLNRKMVRCWDAGHEGDTLAGVAGWLIYYALLLWADASCWYATIRYVLAVLWFQVVVAWVKLLWVIYRG